MQFDFWDWPIKDKPYVNAMLLVILLWLVLHLVIGAFHAI